MKLRQVLLITLLAVTALAAPTTSASASPSLAHLSAHSLHLSSSDTTAVSTLCLNTQDDLCLNLQNCGSSNWLANPVQLWNILSGGGLCSDNWNVTELAGGVGQPGVGNVFVCGDDLNAKYYGDPVFAIAFNYRGLQNSVISNGHTQPVYLSSVHDYWVAANNNDVDTTLIDANASCNNNGQVQYVYAGCKGNGCLVRESPNPASLLFWQYDIWNV